MHRARESRAACALALSCILHTSSECERVSPVAIPEVAKSYRNAGFSLLTVLKRDSPERLRSFRWSPTRSISPSAKPPRRRA